MRTIAEIVLTICIMVLVCQSDAWKTLPDSFAGLFMAFGTCIAAVAFASWIAYLAELVIIDKTKPVSVVPREGKDDEA